MLLFFLHLIHGIHYFIQQNKHSTNRTVSTQCSLWNCSLDAQRLTLCLGVGHFPDLSAGGGLTDVPVLLPIVLHLSLQTWLKTHTHTHTLMQTYTCTLISTSSLKSLNHAPMPQTQILTHLHRLLKKRMIASLSVTSYVSYTAHDSQAVTHDLTQTCLCVKDIRQECRYPKVIRSVR